MLESVEIDGDFLARFVLVFVLFLLAVAGLFVGLAGGGHGDFIAIRRMCRPCERGAVDLEIEGDDAAVGKRRAERKLLGGRIVRSAHRAGERLGRQIAGDGIVSAERECERELDRAVGRGGRPGPRAGDAVVLGWLAGRLVLLLVLIVVLFAVGFILVLVLILIFVSFVSFLLLVPFLFIALGRVGVIHFGAQRHREEHRRTLIDKGCVGRHIAVRRIEVSIAVIEEVIALAIKRRIGVGEVPAGGLLLLAGGDVVNPNR